MEVKQTFTPQLILKFKYRPLQKAIRATEKLLVIISTEKYKFSEVKYTRAFARAYPNFDKGVVVVQLVVRLAHRVTWVRFPPRGKLSGVKYNLYLLSRR